MQVTRELLTVSFGGIHPARIERAEKLTWEQYRQLLTQDVPESGDKASRGWSIPGSFSESWRDADNLISRDALTIDYDRIGKADVATIEAAYKPYEYVLYTTASHTSKNPRLRLVMPLTHAVSADEFCAVSRRIAAGAGIELASRESHVPAQMMFLPTVKAHQTFRAKHNPGNWVDPDVILAMYADWTDRSSWPHRKTGDHISTQVLGTPPTEKPGIVGSFCRCFTVSEAIEHFKLPYTRVR